MLVHMNRQETVVKHYKLIERLSFYNNKLNLERISNSNTSTFIVKHQQELNLIVKRLLKLYYANLNHLQMLNYYEHLNICYQI